MAELQDYLMSSTSLESYMPDELVGSVINEKSKTNLAANIAILSEDPVNTFGIVKSELSTGVVSNTQNSIMNKIEQEGVKANQQLFMDMMVDPNTSDEERVRMAELLAIETAGTKNEHDVLSEQLLMQSDGVDTDEGFLTRDQLVNIYRGANRLRAETQKIQNAENILKDQSLFQKALDIGEMIVPFVEQGLLETLTAELEAAGIDTDTWTGTAFLAMGHRKKKLAEAFQKMSMPQRAELLTKVVDLVKSNDSALFDSNGYRLADTLNTILVDGSYTTSDKWIDTAIGLLDLVGIGGLVKSAGKVGKAAKKGSKLDDLPTELVDADDVTFPSRETSVEPTKTPSVKELDSSRGEVDYADVTTKSVQTEVVRISPVENINRNNTGKGRQIHEAVLADNTGQVADAVGGTRASEIVANNLLPQVRKTQEGVDYKLPTPNYIRDSELRGNNPKRVVDVDSEAGRVYYYNSEKVKERALVVNDFQNSLSLNARPNLSSVAERTDGVDIGVTYAPLHSGYANANDAIELVKYHHRGYGITDENITLLKNTDKGYQPVKIEKDMPLGDYLVQVDYKHRFSAKRGLVTGKRSDTMIEEAPGESWVNTVFETFGPVGGAIRANLLAGESVLDRNLMSGAFVSVDQSVKFEKALVDLIKDFVVDYRSMKKSRKNVFMKAINEANNKGIAYSAPWAKGKWGMTEKEYQTLLKFKNAQDNLWLKENEDFITTLKNNGFGLWTDGAGSKLLAKPVPVNQAGGIRQVLDPNTNKVVELSKQQISDLYKDGGTIAKLRTNFEVDGQMVAHMMSAEKIDTGYFRSLNQNDVVLNYREGYFRRVYEDPIFIDEILPDGSTRAFATADSTKNAKMFIKEFKKANPGREFDYRPDKKATASLRSDDDFDISVSEGRSTQMYRGKELYSSNDMGQAMETANLMDPVEAYKNAAMSLASRMSMRDYLDAYLTRLMKTYEDLMPRKDGQPVIPQNPADITDPRGRFNNPRVRQARGLLRQYNLLTASHQTRTSSFIQHGMNSLAEVVGEMEFRGASKLEGAARSLGKVDPIALSTKTAFLAHIATSPLSQIITQGGGVVLSAARAPVFALAPNGLLAQMTALNFHRAGFKIGDEVLKFLNLSREEFTKLADEFERSGLPYAADANNLMRHNASSMSERDWAALRSESLGSTIQDGVTLKGAGREIGAIGSKALRVSQLGFDAGEFLNLQAAYLVQAHKARKAGKLNNAEDWEFVAADSRNMTGGMSKAGQFAYQNNELRVILQYMPIVQKSLALMTFGNRMIKPSTRIKLGAAVVVLFGTDIIPVVEGLVDRMTEDWPKDPIMNEWRTRFTEGFLQYSVNTALSLMTGEEQRIAVRERINPFDYNGGQERTRDLISDFSIIEMFTESPSGQVISKIGSAIGDGMRFLNFSDKNLPDNPADFMAFANSVGSISSGYSNMFKAKMAWSYGKKFSGTGYISDQNATSLEAIVQIFGFRTIDEARSFKLREEIYGTGQREAPGWSSEDDVKEWYKGVKRDLFMSGEDPASLDSQKKIYGNIGHHLFSDSPQNLLYLRKLIDRDAKSGDYTLLNGILDAMKANTSASELKSMINKLPNMDREKIASYLEMVDGVEEMKESIRGQ